ncbi:acyltransferase family protein [Rothia sp. CCM 9418]|uniref:acyltransferase family protein n=1 Tax=Rothia sp. CCM 9418 TaxID=3402661 RepID=UPI003ADE3B00
MNQEHVFYSSVDPAEGQRKYRLPGLDGLRALAVLCVVVYHLWPGVLPGGMIGVDIFFVISGYLITALLLREGAYTGKMNIIDFWVRRARRLIPSIVLLIIVIGTLTLIIGHDAQVNLGRQIFGAFTFSSNWLYIFSGNDYFTQTSPELLTNFWSLAVEEQFYILWPVVLVIVFMFVSRWSRRALIPVILGLLSVLLCVVLNVFEVSPNRIYYGTDTHLFPLMLGVLLALMIPWSMYPPADSRLYQLVGYGEHWQGALRSGAGWLALFGLVLYATLLEQTQIFFMPGGLFFAGFLALAVIQALLPDVHNPASDVLRQVLSWAPLVWIGRRSYGIYLWHWPLYVLAHYTFGVHQKFWVEFFVLFLTLIISGLSYMYVEEPIRQRGFVACASSVWNTFSGAQKLPSFVALGAVLLCTAATTAAVITAPKTTSAEDIVAAGAQAQKAHEEHIADQKPTPTPDADSAAATERESSSKQATRQEENPSVTVIGDSVSLASAEALHEALPDATVDGEVSRTIVKAFPVISRLNEHGQLGSVVVLSVTTNSTYSIEEIDQLIKDISDHGQRKIVLVTGAAPAHLTWVQDSNKVIKEAAAKYPKSIVIADWAKAAQNHPEYFVSDGVHPQAIGQKVYAQTIATAVAQAEKDLEHQDTAEEEPAEPVQPATSPAW